MPDLKSQLKSRKNKIKRLAQGIINTGVWKDDEPIELNYNNILTDLYAINTLINYTFEIFKDTTTSNEEKANKLLKLRDNNNNKIITNFDDALRIVLNNKEPLMSFYNERKTRQKEITSEVIKNKIQLGGAVKNSGKAELDIDDILKNIERVALDKSKKFSSNIASDPNYLADIVSEIPDEMINNDVNNTVSKLETVTDWIFHPLWKLENTPIWGSIIEVPIDMVDALLNNCILIVETVYPLISIILSFVGTAGISSAVAIIPIIGPVLGGSAWEVVVQPFLDWLIPNFLKIIAFFINVWRRDLPSAYINALDFIPFMENTMHVFAGYLIKINKYINIVYPITNTVRSYTEFSTNLALVLLKNPGAFTDIDKFYIDIIKPNKTKIPIMKDLPKELLDKDDVILSIFYEIIHDLTKCARKAIDSGDMSSCIEDFKLENIRNKVTERVKQILEKK